LPKIEVFERKRDKTLGQRIRLFNITLVAKILVVIT